LVRSARRWPVESSCENRLGGEAHTGEVVQRLRYRDGTGEIGVIASVTRPLCGGCTRARLSADGRLFTCMFAINGHDLRALLRGGASDAEICAAIGGIWRLHESARPTSRRCSCRCCPVSRCVRARCSSLADEETPALVR
jgi:molybdenum cofactor biosynthesis enzyme MoaA